MVNYGCQTWSLSVGYVNILLVLERPTLGRLHGPVRTEEEWRMRNNDKLETLMTGDHIVKYIKYRE